MPEKLTLEKSERDNNILGAYINKKETADVLDILRKVDGLTFDFHKKLYLNEKQRNEFHSHVRNFCRNYVSERIIKIPFNSIESVSDSELSRLSEHTIEMVYSFGKMSSEELVNTFFENGYVRIGDSRAIISFNGLPILSRKISEYECKMIKNNYQSKLCEILKGKLPEPQFLTYDHVD